MQAAALALALQVMRLPSATTLQLDGKLDEPFWQSIVPAEEFYQVLPQSGLPAPFKTSVRVAMDEQNFYIGVELEDPPGSPRLSNISRRDHIPDSDDTLTITLDPIGTRAFAQVFQVNPDCSTSDGLYKEANLSTDLSSDFFYSVACHGSDSGWSVEFKIPLHELRYTRGSQRPWNMLVQRSLLRDQRRTVANAPLPRDPLCLLCLAPALETPGELPDSQFLRWTPYALMRQTETTRVAHGVDVKYRLSSDSILDATVNPDFSQVNLDEPQLSANTRFAVSYPENRPFFLEGSDILETPLKVVTTRSITQPSWGLKYTYRTEQSDTMILSGDDRSDNRILIPGAYGSRFEAIKTKQKFWVGCTRWKRDDYQLGLTLTNRAYENLGSNQTLAVDSMHYLSSEDSLRWQSILSHSHDQWDASPKKNGDAHFLLFQHKGAAWQSSAELKSFSENFRSDLGFNPRNNYRLGILTNTWHQALGEQHIAWYLRLSKKTELSPRPIQNQAAPGMSFSGFLGGELNLETRPDTSERIRESGRLHRYTQHAIALSFYPGSVLTWLRCDLTWGERLDVTDDRVRPGRVEGCATRLALGKKVEWNASLSQERLMQDAWHDQQDAILVNRVSRHLLIVPFHRHVSLRYIRQEAKAQRIDSAASRSETDSWNLTYENPESLTVQAGATLARESGQTQKDYYLKISASLP